jgi:hypothetical protein
VSEVVMKKTLIIISAVSFVFGLVGVAGAGLVNGGFETGDLTGWSDEAVVVTTATIDGRIFTPAEGKYFAMLDIKYQNFYTQKGGSISQIFSIGAGQVISGSILNYGVLPYGGETDVSIFNESHTSKTSLISKNYNATNLLSGGWDTWSWTAPYSGTFDLRIYSSAWHNMLLEPYMQTFVDGIIATGPNTYGFFVGVRNTQQSKEPDPSIIPPITPPITFHDIRFDDAASLMSNAIIGFNKYDYALSSKKVMVFELRQA